jgi:hypothetical protein
MSIFDNAVNATKSMLSSKSMGAVYAGPYNRNNSLTNAKQYGNHVVTNCVFQFAGR